MKNCMLIMSDKSFDMIDEFNCIYHLRSLANYSIHKRLFNLK